MPPSGLQLYLRPYVTLTFNLLIPKVDRLMLLPRRLLLPICIKIGSKHHVHKFGYRRYERMKGRMNGQPDNITPPRATLAQWRHKKEKYSKNTVWKLPDSPPRRGWLLKCSRNSVTFANFARPNRYPQSVAVIV